LSFLQKRCKARLKAQRAAGRSPRLAAVQHGLAREYGFKTWARLKAAVAAQATRPPAPAEAVAAFLEAVVPPATDHRAGTATAALDLLNADPLLAAASIHAAAAAGNATAVERFLAEDPTLATRPGGPHGWQPLSYLCFSRLLRFGSARRRAEFLRCARALLKDGADPNTSFVNPPDGVKESALYGAAGVANDPALTRLLLEAGADVNDGESLYHAAEFRDHRCLELLLQHKPTPAPVSYCLLHKMDQEDVAGVRLFLKYGADPNFVKPQEGLRPLGWALLRGRSARVFKALLEAGADPTLPGPQGESLYVMARKRGRTDVAALFAARGARAELAAKDAFLAACAEGDAATARRLLRDEPTLVTGLGFHERMVLPQAAAAGNRKAVALMIDLGFPVDTPGGWGGSALHQAAWRGKVGMVRLLLARGADPHAKQHWGGDVLHTALHGARHGGHRAGLAVVRALLRHLPKDAVTDGHRRRADGDGDPAMIALLAAGAAPDGGPDRSPPGAPPAPAAGADADPFVSSLPPHRKGHKIARWKPLMDAAFAGDVPRIRKLLEAGTDANVVSATPQRYRPLHRAIEPKKTQPRDARHVEAVRVLLEGGADPHLRGTGERLTALGLAAVGDRRFVALLRPRFEPLHLFHAAALADVRRVGALLHTDAGRARAADENGWTPLHYAANSCLFEESPAAKAGLLEIARLLLAAGADVGARYLYDGEWPIPVLYGPCGRHDFPEMAEALIAAGANPCDGESVYHAADEGHAGALAVIERRTDPAALAAECGRCLATMMHWHRTRGLPWLLAHGADPNVLNRWGNSALHEAAIRGSAPAVIRLLLSHGGDAARANAAGLSAIDLASRHGRARVLAELCRPPA
jgi:ankyrin repeat protein